MLNRNAVEKLCEIMKERNLDAILTAPSNDLLFLMGESPWLCERFQGLFVKQNGECFYIVNLLSGGEVEAMAEGDFPVYTWWDGEDFTNVVEKVFAQEGLLGKTIGVNLGVRASNILQITNKMDVKFTDARDIFNEVRIHKTSEELDAMRASAEIADEALLATWKDIKVGMSEQDVRNIIRSHMDRLGGKDGDAIVCFGANASYPHYMPSGDGAILKEKDIILIDFGCTYKGFQSDMTRTVFVGEPTEREKLIYNTVLKANLVGEEAVFEGAYIPDIDKAARNVIEEAGYGEWFTTRLGHGIGYQGHESPDIKQSNERNLEKGMAFSIEPGIYISGEIGVRVEDIVVINEKGEREILNHVTKDIVVL